MHEAMWFGIVFSLTCILVALTVSAICKGPRWKSPFSGPLRSDGKKIMDLRFSLGPNSTPQDAGEVAHMLVRDFLIAEKEKCSLVTEGAAERTKEESKANHDKVEYQREWRIGG